MHAVRREAVCHCVHSLLNGAMTSVTGIGRNLSGLAFEKHKIKRVDRLCSNPYLHHEINDIYCAVSRWMIGSQTTPVILVDWSDLDDRQQHFLLRASLVYDGRALTLYQEVHGLATKDKPASHEHFLERLKKMVPKDNKPVVVTDAGFRGPWFKLVEKIGWDYVGRVRNKTQYQFIDQPDSPWKPIKSLYAKATKKPKLVGDVALAKLRPTRTRLVLFKKKAQGRHRLTRHGEVAQWTNSKLAAQREREPWLLATSLPINSSLTKKTVAIYKTRMQIEEAFRDTKSILFGQGFSASNTRQIKRLSTLLLLSALASFIALITGMMAESEGLQKRYQSNTIRHRRVLSLQYLGLLIYQKDVAFYHHWSWKKVMRLFTQYRMAWEKESG